MLGQILSSVTSGEKSQRNILSLLIYSWMFIEVTQCKPTEIYPVLFFDLQIDLSSYEPT